MGSCPSVVCGRFDDAQHCLIERTRFALRDPSETRREMQGGV